MTRFEVIFAAHEDVHGNLGIGFKGRLPWNIPGEMAHFKNKTTYTPDGFPNAVIMGRATWEGLPHKPLQGRFNIVVTSKEIPYVDTARSLNEAMDLAREHRANTAFIIGGERLIEEALRHDQVRTLHLTKIWGDVQCDTFVSRSALHGWTVVQRRSSKAHEHMDGRNGLLVYRFFHLTRFRI